MATYIIVLAPIVVPLSVYFLYLAWMNSRPHPSVSTGGRDLGMLGFGLAGLVVLGPLGRALVFSGRWWGDASLVAMLVGLVVLTLSDEPSAVIVYNVDQPVLWEALHRALQALSWPYEVRTDRVDLPDQQAVLDVRYFRAMRNASVYVRGGPRHAGLVRRLQQELRRQVATVPTPGRFAGRCFLVVGVALLTLPVYLWLADALDIVVDLPGLLGR